MLQKLFFLVDLFNVNHSSWYTNSNGFTTGLILAFAVALIACLFFYYVWGKMRALTMMHYILTGIVNAVVTLLVVFFTARKLLTAYAIEAGLSEIDPSILSQIKNGTFDMWLFAINSAIWGVVFYFLLSIVLKNWSELYSIPFGSIKRIKKQTITR
jgi:hypothetical protein